VPNFVGAIQDFNEGNIVRGLEQAVPGSFKGAFTAYRLATEGAETRGGDQIVGKNEFTPGQLVMQGIGFQPTNLSEAQQKSYAFKKRIKNVETERRQLMQKFNAERYEERPDPDKLRTYLQKMVEFNDKYPFPSAQITPAALQDSFQSYKLKRQFMLRGLPIGQKDLPYVLPDLLRTYPGYENVGHYEE
jgi:hypothetical protein